jgi:hypothetical protein
MWECLELQPAGLFHELVSGIGNPRASERAYGAVTIWSIRRAMLRAAAESHFADFRTKISKTNKSLHKLSGSLRGAPQ